MTPSIHRRIGLTAVLATTTLVLAACGSGAGSAPTVAPASSVAAADTSPSTTTTAAPIPVPDDLPTEPVYAVLDGGEIVTVDPATGEQTPHLSAPAEAILTTAVELAPTGELIVTTVESTPRGACNQRLDHLADEPVFADTDGYGPAFSADASMVAYVADGFARHDETSPRPGCIYDTIVIRDLATGSEREWRRTPESDVTGPDLEMFYDLIGVITGLRFSPDGTSLSFDTNGEASWAYRLDLGADRLEPVRVSVTEAVDAALLELLPDGYSLATLALTDGGEGVIALAWSWDTDGWARLTGRGVVLDEIIESSPDPVGALATERRDGFAVGVDRVGDGSLVRFDRDGNQAVLIGDGVWDATW